MPLAHITACLTVSTPSSTVAFFHRQTKEGIFYDESRQGFLAEVADEEELERLFHSAVREMAPMLDRLAALSTQADDNEADRETAFYIGLLARMLLSAVIEGDRTDTAAFMDGIEPPVFPEDMRPIWTERLAFMEKKLAAFPRKTPIDLARHTISDTCAAGAARPGGVYRLNVPTGGGKTLASLRFALTHAAKWNCSRIIFTAPLLSILDQNAQVIRDYIGDDTLILEHHSNLAEPKETPERLQELELLTASWSAPIIITTLVQLLNTCFSGRTSAIRRFHALCGSVIVIDEVQTVPGKMLTLFNLAVNFLSEVCGATIVLCSATQPCLEAADHPLHRQPVDLVPQQKALWDVFKRTDIQNAGCAKLEELSQIVTEVLSSCDSLLVVCNTKKGGGVPVRVAANRELPVLPSVRRHVHAAPQGDSASLTVRAGQALRRQAKGCLRLHAGDRGRCGHLLPAGDPLLRRNGQCRAGGRAVQPARRAKRSPPPSASSGVPTSGCVVWTTSCADRTPPPRC